MSEIEHLDTPSGYLQAFDRLLAGTHRHLRIFDQDLRELDLGKPQNIAALKGLALSGGRVEILLRDWAPVRDYMPGVMSLLQNFSHLIAIRQEEVIEEPSMESFCVGDDSSVLVRPHRHSWRSQLYLNDPLAAQVHIRKFEPLWQRAEGPLSFKPLGL
jgi:hypothetical protein